MIVHRLHCHSYLGSQKAVFEWFTSHVSLAFYAIDHQGDEIVSPLYLGELLAIRMWCHETFGSERRMRWRFTPRLNVHQNPQLARTVTAFEFHYHSDLTLFVTRWQGVSNTEFLELSCQTA